MKLCSCVFPDWVLPKKTESASFIDNNASKAYFSGAPAKSGVRDWSLVKSKAHKSPASLSRLFLCVLHASFGELDGGRSRPAVSFVTVRPTRSAHLSIIGLFELWALTQLTKDSIMQDMRSSSTLSLSSDTREDIKASLKVIYNLSKQLQALDLDYHQRVLVLASMAHLNVLIATMGG